MIFQISILQKFTDFDNIDAKITRLSGIQMNSEHPLKFRRRFQSVVGKSLYKEMMNMSHLEMVSSVALVQVTPGAPFVLGYRQGRHQVSARRMAGIRTHV